MNALTAAIAALPLQRRHPEPDPELEAAPEVVVWTARCPHGRDVQWQAAHVRDDGELHGPGLTRISCPCPCTEPAP